MGDISIRLAAYSLSTLFMLSAGLVVSLFGHDFILEWKYHKHHENSNIGLVFSNLLAALVLAGFLVLISVVTFFKAP